VDIIDKPQHRDWIGAGLLGGTELHLIGPKGTTIDHSGTSFKVEASQRLGMNEITPITAAPSTS
jgi:hypothetical protein